MIGILERRLQIERLLGVIASAEPQAARLALAEALEDAERGARRESSMLLGAVVALLDGKATISLEVLAALGPADVLEIQHLEDGGLTLKSAQLPPLLVAAVQATRDRGALLEMATTDTAPGVDFPPANPQELDGPARIRICHAVRTLLRRHYDGEIRARGMEFLVGVCGELLAMAVGQWAANERQPNRTIALRFEELRPDLETRSVHYQQQAEDVLDALNLSVDPGEQPPADGSTRLH